ncbi:MAG: 4'-phosphopantetheinyl transferase family protein [Leptodesmis sp.]
MVWQPSSIAALPPAGTVHVWRASLIQPPAIAQQLAQSLSLDEQAKVERFRFVQHQQRSLISRGLLRSLLGRYLETDPATLKFDYEAHGKPVLSRSPGWPNVQFNLAHSQDLVVYAIAVNFPVGIDVEYQRTMADRMEIVQRFFSTSEQQALNKLSGEVQKTAFFDYWTGKEAVLKATGQGLAGLSSVEISLPDCSVHLQGDLAQRYPTQSWQIRLFEPEENYSGAIAIPRPEAEFLFFEWQKGSSDRPFLE